MRRHTGGEAEADALLPVDRRRDPRGQVIGLNDGRVLLVRWDQRHRVAIDVAQHDLADARQPHLRVAHGRSGVVVVATEVALTIDERVAHREVLGQPDGSVVNRLLAVWMGLAHHCSDDFRRLDGVM